MIKYKRNFYLEFPFYFRRVYYKKLNLYNRTHKLNKMIKLSFNYFLNLEDITYLNLFEYPDKWILKKEY